MSHSKARPCSLPHHERTHTLASAPCLACGLVWLCLALIRVVLPCQVSVGEAQSGAHKGGKEEGGASDKMNTAVEDLDDGSYSVITNPSSVPTQD